MNLNDFERHISDAIVRRGRDYYEGGHVASLELTDGAWVAEVSGNEDYTVTVELSGKDKIVETTCDCPYDYGPYCKHQAAVFFALRERPEGKEDLKSVLLAQSKDELVAAILERVREDKSFQSDLLLRFAPKEDVVERARDLVKNSIQGAMHRGFVEYRAAGRAVYGAKKALELAAQLANDEQYIDCARLYIAVLDELAALLDRCDDSDGIVDGVIGDTVRGLAAALSDFTPGFEGGCEVFRLVEDRLAPKRGIDYGEDLRLSLLATCVPLCADAALRARVETHLDVLPLNEYSKQRAQGIRAEIIAAFDGEEALEAFQADHLDNPLFVDSLIERAVKQRRWERALQLCRDAEATYRNDRRWVRTRYAIYERMEDKSAQAELAQQLVKAGDFAYYEKLKGLCSPEEWPERLEEILAEPGKESWIDVRIAVAEGLKERLWEVCKRAPSLLPELSSHLLPEHRQDMVPMFEELVRAQAGGAADRGSYRKVGELLRRFAGACGAIPAQVMVGELLEAYKRRPAFVDELNKVIASLR